MGNAESIHDPYALDHSADSEPEPLPTSLTTSAPGTKPYWQPGLYSGDADATHHFGRCPDFSPAHLRAQRPEIPRPGLRPPGPGQMPPRVQSLRYHDRMHFYHPSGQRHATLRDLGFSSVLDGRILWTFGDTHMGDEAHPRICATTSSAVGTKDAPMVLMDTAFHPTMKTVVRNWVDCLPPEEADGGFAAYAFGNTNVVEVAPNLGVFYFLKNHRPGGVNHFLGAGVATCSIDGDNVPRASRTVETMWAESEPFWGDVGICLEPRERRIYVWGKGPWWDDQVKARTYLARVPADAALDVDAYEYWRNDTRTWGRQRLGDGSNGTSRLTPEMAIFGWNYMNQGAPFWSNYFNTWMWIHGSAWPRSDVMIMTADRLEGPWERHKDVARTKPRGHRDGFRYCITGHPEYDDSGKTIFVTWTVNNSIWGVTIEWE